MLHFGIKPPFSFEKFLQICRELILERDIEVLEKASIRGDYEYARNEADILTKWHAFDTALRNELVKIRASHKRLDPLKYIRQDGYQGPAISHIAMNAHRSTSPLEAERMLDQERWHVLEELKRGHYFDLDFLIAYGHELLILERWERINTADKSHLVEEALKKS